MAFDFKTATPVTSGVTLDFFVFGANSQAVTNPSIYSINAIATLLANTNVNIGNSTVNTFANSVIVKVADATGAANLNSSSLQIQANVLLDTVKLSIGNSTVNTVANSVVVKVADATGTANVKPGSIQVQANVLLDTVKLSIGNTTANLTANSIIVQVANASGTANLQPTQLVVGNSTVYATIGSATRSITGSNTFNLGTAAATANGYTFLFNGILLQWGWVDANTTVGDVTFQVPFPTAIFSYQATSNSAVAGNTAAIIAANTTVMQVRSTSTAAASNTFWLAIGN